jgi:hypothetical protein
VQLAGVGRPVRRVLRLVERTIGAAGQHLILPEYELDGWTTTLPARIGAGQVIALYDDHGTHEQGPSSFRVEPNRQNGRSSSSPVGMWAGCL